MRAKIVGGGERRFVAMGSVDLISWYCLAELIAIEILAWPGTLRRSCGVRLVAERLVAIRPEIRHHAIRPEIGQRLVSLAGAEIVQQFTNKSPHDGAMRRFLKPFCCQGQKVNMVKHGVRAIFVKKRVSLLGVPCLRLFDVRWSCRKKQAAYFTDLQGLPCRGSRNILG